MENATEQATEIVDLIRRQNWKNGGVMSVDHGDAVELVAQALRTAFAAGEAAGGKDMGESMLKTFDTAAP